MKVKTLINHLMQANPESEIAIFSKKCPEALIENIKRIKLIELDDSVQLIFTGDESSYVNYEEEK